MIKYLEPRKLSVLLPLPPEPVNRLIAVIRSGGRKCGACGKPAKVWADTRKDTRGKRDKKTWRRQVEDSLRLAWWGEKPLNGPLRATLVFVLPRPASRPTEPLHTTRKVGGNTLKIKNPRRQAGHWIVSPDDWARGDRVRCPRKPDLDRMTNAIFDALTEVGAWHDDCQVVCWGPATGKWYAAVGEQPSIRVTVEGM